MKNFPRYLIIFIFLFLFLQVFANGFLPVRNFSKSQYTGGAQNWAVATDSLGRTFIGNQSGMLVFDGTRWQKFYLPNYTPVRSLHLDFVSDRLYAGGSNLFGFFSLNKKTGVFEFISLSDKLSSSFAEIWNILGLDGDIYFQSDYLLFRYDGNSISILDPEFRISTSSIIEGALYVASDDGSIKRLDGDNFIPLKGIEDLKGKRIMALLPSSDGNILIGTSTDGLYDYSENHYTLLPVISEINEFLKKNQLFTASENNGFYIFGTVNSGAVFLEPEGDIYYINKSTGLQNNTILKSGTNSGGNVWLCLDNGLAYVVRNSDTHGIMVTENSIGTAYTSYIFDDKILLGTNQGLFISPYPVSFSLKPGELPRIIQGQIWNITQAPEGLFISADKGGFYFSNGSLHEISELPGTYFILPVVDNPKMAVASSYDGLHLLSYSDGKWRHIKKLNNTSELRGRFFFDRHGNLWIANWQKGVYRLLIDFENGDLKELFLFNSSTGLPADENNSVAVLGDKIIFSTVGGFYTPSQGNSKKAVPYKELNLLISENRYGPLQNLTDKRMVMLDNRGLMMFEKNNDNSFKASSYSGPLLYESLVPGFTSVIPAEKGEYIVSTEDGFVSLHVSNTNRDGHKADISPFISTVYANNDSVVYNAPFTQRNNVRNLEIPYDLNSLRFEFAYPDYSFNDAFTFSSFLENYEKDWSPFSKVSSREYTRLHEGNYILHLKVRDNSTGDVKETEFSFSVLPPWYRSWWMKIIYIIVSVLALYTIVFFIRRKFEKTKQRLESNKEKEMAILRKESEKEAIRKDYEIANLKSDRLEQEIQHKSRELSNTAMNLIRKNEVLREISEHISRLQNNPSTASASLQLAKLQNLIQQSIAREDERDTFNRNFNLVYGDFTNRLKELHPNLTNSDQRLCCYIRMGLSSKEIAPLINISFKSVEMARYRLRKKMNLGTEASLTEYLASIDK